MTVSVNQTGWPTGSGKSLAGVLSRGAENSPACWKSPRGIWWSVWSLYQCL